MKTFFLFLLFFASAIVVTPVFALEPVDTDGDGLSDVEETTIYHTDVNNSDTDSDGYNDGEEVRNAYSPRHGEGKRLRDVDSDSDGAWDDWEIALQTDLTNADTDGDGYSDGMEVMRGYDPLLLKSKRVEKRIEVSLADQRANYFFGNTVLDGFSISSGLSRTPTPKGAFKVIKKRPTVWYKGAGYNYPETKWNLMFKYGSSSLNYYIHGAYWHDEFGSVRSAGCVNVPYEYAYMGRLYDWADVGTPVLIQ